MAPYIVAEQDTRLQSIFDENKNVFFLSGHTHGSPTIEFDKAYGNLYINERSVCPTTVKGEETATQQGNVTLFEISEAKISVIIKGVYSEMIFIMDRSGSMQNLVSDTIGGYNSMSDKQEAST